MSNLSKQFKDTGSVEVKPVKNRPGDTKASEFHFLVITAVANKNVTSSQFSLNLYAVTERRFLKVTA